MNLDVVLTRERGVNRYMINARRWYIPQNQVAVLHLRNPLSISERFRRPRRQEYRPVACSDMHPRSRHSVSHCEKVSDGGDRLPAVEAR
jgi:hypothetical protein